MAELRSPFDGAVIDVPDGLVDRYVASGWVQEAKPVRRRKASESDDEGK